MRTARPLTIVPVCILVVVGEVVDLWPDGGSGVQGRGWCPGVGVVSRGGGGVQGWCPRGDGGVQGCLGGGCVLVGVSRGEEVLVKGWCLGEGMSTTLGHHPTDQDLLPPRASPPSPVTMWPIPWCIWCHLSSPWVGQTDACENITFTHFATFIPYFLFSSFCHPISW